jgi:uncharacterized iron-regulated protein
MMRINLEDRMEPRKIVTVLITFLLAASLFAILEEKKEDRSLILKIGDAKYKDKFLEVAPGTIYSAEEGSVPTLQKAILEMKSCRFVYVGENHDSLATHEIELKIIQALYAQDKNLSIGLEMFPETIQEALNKWSLGILSSIEFIREGKWYVNWNFNFGFYEKIFEFAKENRIPIYGLNAPKEVITKIRMGGWESLSEEEKKLVPKPDLTNQEHRLLIRTIFESTELPPQMKGMGLDMVFEGLYRAQSAWDQVMAWNAVRRSEMDGKRMAVLAGSGHLLYNLGINHRVYEQNRLPFKTVICVAVPKEKKTLQVTRSVGDYVWGIAEEERPAYPSVGLSFKKFEGLENLVIESKPIDGVAKGGDFEKGDIVLSVDGKLFSDINDLRIYLARFKWGDGAKFRLLRNAKEIEVFLKFELPKN